jgi:hypothetical protein
MLGNSDSSMPLKPLCTFGTNVKSTKWKSNSVRKCVLDTMLLSRTICYLRRQIELFQILWSSSSFTMSKSFGLTKAETRNLPFKNSKLYPNINLPTIYNFGFNTKIFLICVPQGSMLAPILFNLYMSDIPITVSKQFQYADDIALTFQANSFAEWEPTLEADLDKLDEFFRRWRLQPNPSKIESCVFHLNTHEANRQLDVKFTGTEIQHVEHSKNLGVTLDHTLTYYTQLPWLPTMAHIVSPKLRRKAAAVRELVNCRRHANSLLYQQFLDIPIPRLVSRLDNGGVFNDGTIQHF